MPDHNIGIIGAGPVGSILAAFLARNNENVFLIDIKEDLISAVIQKGLSIKGAGHDFRTNLDGAGYFTASLKRFKPDFIFIAIKANALDVLLEELSLIIEPGQNVLVVQNGIDNENTVAEIFNPDSVFRFVINYAGMIKEPGSVQMSFFNPPNYLGAVTPAGEATGREIAGMINDSGLETVYTDNIKRYEWKKTILNAALMPVCATTGMTMKEAMTNGETRFLAEQILTESIEVAKKVGFEYEANFFENCLSYLSNAGHHKPSTSLDLEAGNPIEYIFQPIIDYGKKTGRPTPFLESLTKVMRALEHRKRAG